MKERATLRFVEAAAVFLFALQAIRVLFSVLFGIIYDVVITGPMTPVVIVIFLLLLLAFLAPLFAPRRTARLRWTLFIPSLLVSLSRIPLTLNDPQARLYSSLLIVAAFGFYAAALFRKSSLTFPQALIAALAADQFFRALGNTFDITLRDGWLPYQVILSVALAGLSWRLFSLARGRVEEVSTQGPGLLGGLAIVLVGALAVTLPDAVRRLPAPVQEWPSRGGQWAVAVLLVIVCAVFAWPPTPQMKEAGPNVRVGDYNIHYGYHTDWRYLLNKLGQSTSSAG